MYRYNTESEDLTLIGGVRVGDAFPVRIMGIINVSPESFYNESVKTSAQSISETASNMQDSGADIIDIGAMSTAQKHGQYGSRFRLACNYLCT